MSKQAIRVFPEPLVLVRTCSTRDRHRERRTSVKNSKTVLLLGKLKQLQLVFSGFGDDFGGIVNESLCRKLCVVLTGVLCLGLVLPVLGFLGKPGRCASAVGLDGVAREIGDLPGRKVMSTSQPSLRHALDIFLFGSILHKFGLYDVSVLDVFIVRVDDFLLGPTGARDSTRLRRIGRSLQCHDVID